MQRFAWMSARTVSQAAAAATAITAELMTRPADATPTEAAIVKAGGLDVLDLLKENLLAPARLVSLREIPGLDVIAEEAGELRIGAMATLARVAADASVGQRYPALADALRSAASPQIRNVATLGGNLLQRPRCWYFRAEAFRCLRKGGGHCFAHGGENQYHAIFDNQACAIVHPSTAATVLVALGASVTLADAGGATRRVLLEDFLVGPDQDMQRENDLRPHEILIAVHLPPASPDAGMAYLKQGQKESFDWPLADVAVVLERNPAGVCKRARVVLGAAAPVPYRAARAEAALTGRRVDETLAKEAAQAAIQGATPLSRNGYKLPLFATLVRRAVLQAEAG